MKQPRNSMQPVRDAAVLLVLILLLLTVRPVGVEAVGELVPETEASPEQGWFLEEPASGPTPAETIDLGGPRHDIPVGIGSHDRAELEIISLDGDPRVEAQRQMICRITASGDGIFTDCSRIARAPSGPKPVRTGWTDSCAEDRQS